MLIAVGIAWPKYLYSVCNVDLCLVVCDHRARLYEASARTLVELDVDGWKYQFKVKTTHTWSTSCRGVVGPIPYRLIHYVINKNSRTSAVNSTNFGSIFIVASCVVGT